MGFLHELIGQTLAQLRFPGATVLLDSECCPGNSEKVRLYGEFPDTEMVRVDSAVALGKEISVVLEVEESNERPVNLCGKLLATAVSHFYSGRRGRLPLSDSLLFVHVIEKKTDDDSWSKLRQCRWLLREIPRIMPHPSSRIARYSFHYGTSEEYTMDSHRNELLSEITSFLAATLTPSAPQNPQIECSGGKRRKDILSL